MIKKLIASLILFTFCWLAAAQNYSVLLWQSQPTNHPMRLLGIPTNLVFSASTISGTNVTAPAIYMDKNTLTNYVVTSRMAASNFFNVTFKNYESNNVFQAESARTNAVAMLQSAFADLEAIAANWSSVTNAATLRNAVSAEGEVLLRLKPVLQELYKP